MQYAVLIYDKPGSYEALSPDEFGRVMAEYGPLTSGRSLAAWRWW